MLEIVCPVCGDISYRRLNSFDLTTQDITLSVGQICLVRCRGCGLVYVNPQPQWEAADIKDLYGMVYFQASYMKFYGGDSLALQTNESFSDRLLLIERYCKNGKILDIGCASGDFVRFAQGQGWDAYGVEASSYAADIAINQQGLKVFKGTLEDAHFPDDFFDVVFMGDVLEHMAKPLGFLACARRSLKAGGLLYVAVPNARSLYYYFFMCLSRFTHKDYFVLPHHLLHFSQSSLTRLISSSGFKVEELRFSSSRFRKKGVKNIFMNALNFLSRLTGLRDRIILIARKV